MFDIIITVSYTHLDEYKRQFQVGSKLIIFKMFSLHASFWCINYCILEDFSYKKIGLTVLVIVITSC